jgi:hypothetical protein
MNCRRGILTLAIFALAAILRGDNLSGKDHVLCTTLHVGQCTSDGQCKSEPQGSLNVPQFFEVNLKDHTVTTTKASGENRSSPVGNLSRDAGIILFQGAENGRAYSFLINESSGMASIAITTDEVSVAVFGPCTPFPDGK